ncbi:uncharacterized protein [Littorina saxatilis]|uniref:Fe2OG dioxygenase domain-containing protein n=2 Tax=Littorina saxatilis TaxID=31220 RepID=A0AAN9G9N4_9CAEN
MTSLETASLPIVDLQKAKDPAQRLAVAKQLVHALETVGFLFVDNAEGYESERLLNNARWFFNLSEQEKLLVSRKLWNRESRNYYRGYFPLQPGEVSFKEGFEIGQDNPSSSNSESRSLSIHPFFTEANLWPSTDTEGAHQFHQDLVEHYRVVRNCGAEILRLVSLGCGLEENWFESLFFPDSLSTLRLLHYPVRGEVADKARDGNTVLCCSEHSDSGFVTLLSTFNYGGLQILQDGSDEWTAVPSRPQSLVMNIGDMLSAMSGGRFKATRHRVVDTRVDRFSVPFFFEPHYAANITRVMPSMSQQCAREVTGDGASESAECHYGPWLIEKMRSFAEYREILDSFTRGNTHAKA